MSTSPNEILTGARTMWELRRPPRRRLPRPPHAHRRRRRNRHLRRVQGPGRASWPPGCRPSGSAATPVVSWQLPTRIDTIVLSMALARLGVVQNPIIHLYREREVGFALRQTGALLFFDPRARGVTPTSRPSPSAPWPASTDAPDRGHDRRRPSRGRPRDAAPAAARSHPGTPRSAGSTTPPARPPTPRASSTPTNPHRRGVGPRPSARHPRRRRRLHRLPVRAHRRARLPRHGADHRLPDGPARGVRARRGRRGLPPPRRHHGRRRAPPSTSPTSPSSARRRATRSSRRCACMSGGGAAKPPEIYFEVGRRDRRSRRRARLRHDRDADDLQRARRATPTSSSPTPTASRSTAPTSASCASTASRPRPGEEGEVRVKGPMVFQGYTDPALTAEAFDDGRLLPHR